MKYLTHRKISPVLALTFALLVTAGPAQAQSTEGVLGGIIGGTAGSVIGGKLDNRGSKTEGKVIGALIGGSLGYVIGDGLNDDDRMRARYNTQSNRHPGSYYTHNGKPYRRYADSQYGYVYVPITGQDRYYHSNGKRKSVANHAKPKRRGVRSNRNRY